MINVRADHEQNCIYSLLLFLQSIRVVICLFYGTQLKSISKLLLFRLGVFSIPTLSKCENGRLNKLILYGFIQRIFVNHMVAYINRSGKANSCCGIQFLQRGMKCSCAGGIQMRFIGNNNKVIKTFQIIEQYAGIFVKFSRLSSRSVLR